VCVCARACLVFSFLTYYCARCYCALK
jgi:hypothetical protein